MTNPTDSSVLTNTCSLTGMLNGPNNTLASSCVALLLMEAARAA